MATLAQFSIDETPVWETSWKSKGRIIAVATIVIILLATIVSVCTSYSVQETAASLTTAPADIVEVTDCVNVTSLEAPTTEHTYARGDIEQSIYFGTWEAVSTFSLATKQVEKIVNSSGDTVIAITHDSVREKIYWSVSKWKIDRANTDGTEPETVLNTSIYGHSFGVAFDWIGGNIYVALRVGRILACSPSTTPALTCFLVLQGQDGFSGIAVNSAEGMMYWARNVPGSIDKAGMDGSSPITIVTGLEFPRALTIDFSARRLYWTDPGTDQIQTSDLDGNGLHTVVQLAKGSDPWGIAVSNDRIYWGTRSNGPKLQSCSKDGQDIQTLYTNTRAIFSLILLPAVNQTTTRKNHCDRVRCSKLCVLSPTSYRCLY